MTASDRPVGFLCIKCNYLLYGLPERRCPECGQPFDPNDVDTVNTGKALGSWARRMLRSPGRWFHGFVLLSVLAALVALTPPDYYSSILALTLLAFFVLGAWWGLRVVLFGIVSAAYRQPVRLHQRAWLAWLIAPALVVMLAGAARLSLPQRVALRVSRSAMDRLSQRVMADPANAPQNGWVGVFPFGSVKTLPNGMSFTIRGAGLFCDCGFAYSNDGTEPKVDDGYVTKHLGDSWWVWEEGF